MYVCMYVYTGLTYHHCEAFQDSGQQEKKHGRYELVRSLHPTIHGLHHAASFLAQVLYSGKYYAMRTTYHAGYNNCRILIVYGSDRHIYVLIIYSPTYLQ